MTESYVQLCGSPTPMQPSPPVWTARHLGECRALEKRGKCQAKSLKYEDSEFWKIIMTQ